MARNVSYNQLREQLSQLVRLSGEDAYVLDYTYDGMSDRYTCKLSNGRWFQVAGDVVDNFKGFKDPYEYDTRKKPAPARWTPEPEAPRYFRR